MAGVLSPEELVLSGRAWRLAILATGDADVARRTLSNLRVPPRGERLDADRIDRLAIQSLRRACGPTARAGPDQVQGPPSPARRRVDPVSLGRAHDVLVALPLQAAEAFVLRRLDELDPIRACRAMDCSRSAADRFLERAERELSNSLGPEHDSAILALKAASDGLAPEPQVVAMCVSRARDRSRRRVALTVTVVAGVLTVLLIVALVLRGRVG